MVMSTFFCIIVYLCLMLMALLAGILALEAKHEAEEERIRKILENVEDAEYEQIQ